MNCAQNVVKLDVKQNSLLRMKGWKAFCQVTVDELYDSLYKLLGIFTCKTKKKIYFIKSFLFVLYLLAVVVI